MAFQTFDHIDVPEWKQAADLYHLAFPKAGRKPDRIIAGMFDKRLSFLHTENEEGQILAMAITGLIPAEKMLLIDYLAVREDRRGKGVGRQFVRNLAHWAKDVMKLRGILIEAEADPGAENEERMRFWERCGFVLTEYVHKYIWVSETYRAMYLPFDSGMLVQDRGQSLFRHIEWFHKQAFTQ